MTIREEKGEGHLHRLNKNIEIGIDEVGRGSVFGPVFSAAVVLSRRNALILKELGVKDSKKLSSKKRELLFPKILELASDYSLGQSSVREIDYFGIRYATELSMIRALKKLKKTPLRIMIDGSLPLKSWEGIQKTVVGGDNKLISIAAASIIAKVNRDSLMKRLEELYSGYYIHKNKGYGTKDHFASIKANGRTNLHRKSFLTKLNLI